MTVDDKIEMLLDVRLSEFGKEISQDLKRSTYRSLENLLESLEWLNGLSLPDLHSRMS